MRGQRAHKYLSTHHEHVLLSFQQLVNPFAATWRLDVGRFHHSVHVVRIVHACSTGVHKTARAVPPVYRSLHLRSRR